MLRPSLLVLAAACAAACLPAPAAAQDPVTFGDAPGTLRLPEALAIAPDGTVLVGDHFGGRIQPFRDGRAVDGAFGVSGETCGRLGSVSGLARARDGRVYVYDSDHQRVHVFDGAGRLVRCFGSNGNGRGQFRTSSGAYAASTGSGGIAVDGAHVYVADTGNNRVQRFTLDGGSPKILARGLVTQPQGLAVRDGRLLVADDGGHRVVELTTSGRFVRATRNGGGFRLRFPYDVALAPNGHAYVADNNGHRIVVLDRRLRRVRAWGAFGTGPGKLIYPRAVAVGPDGHVFVADPGNDRVTEYTARGVYVRTLGRGGRAAGAISRPADVAVNARGEVAVADANMRVSWFDLGGRWLGRWAQGKSFQQSTAALNAPKSLAFADDTHLLVADGGAILRYGAGEARDLLGTWGGGLGAVRVRTLDRDPATGTTWALLGDGRLAPVGENGLGRQVGDEDPRDRAATDVAVLGDGTLAVAEGAAEHRPRPADGIVRRYDAAGRRIGTWAVPRPPGGEASKPGGLVSDRAGGVWVSDAANGRVLRLGPDGAVVATLGTVGTGAGQLAIPTGLALDCEGALVVADTGNNRVVRFPGAAPATGCAPLGTPAAAARIPRPVDLGLRVRTKARRPAGTLATITVRCRRACTLSAKGTGGALARGRAGSFSLGARVRGRTVTLTASPDTLRRMRSALHRRRGTVSAGVVVTARSRDGITDVESLAVRWRAP